MIAHFGMYPFVHLRDAYDELWAGIASRLDGAPTTIDHEIDLAPAWRSPDLLVGQTCGWPLVTQLTDDVAVIGAFDVRAPFAAGGRYRSVLVAAKPIGVAEWRANPATVVAQNGPESLSGWISLRWAWGGVPEHVLVTGGHVASMRAVAAGDAQVASIDALSFEFMAESEAATVGRLHIIGHGPVVGSLPLVMSKALEARRADVRAAIAGAVADPALAAACARLRISGFVPFERSEYEALPALVPPPAR